MKGNSLSYNSSPPPIGSGLRDNYAGAQTLCKSGDDWYFFYVAQVSSTTYVRRLKISGEDVNNLTVSNIFTPTIGWMGYALWYDYTNLILWFIYIEDGTGKILPYYSSNLGDSWTQVYNGSTTVSSYCWNILISRGRCYLVVGGMGGPYTLYSFDFSTSSSGAITLTTVDTIYDWAVLGWGELSSHDLFYYKYTATKWGFVTVARSGYAVTEYEIAGYDAVDASYVRGGQITTLPGGRIIARLRETSTGQWHLVLVRDWTTVHNLATNISATYGYGGMDYMQSICPQCLIYVGTQTAVIVDYTAQIVGYQYLLVGGLGASFVWPNATAVSSLVTLSALSTITASSALMEGKKIEIIVPASEYTTWRQDRVRAMPLYTDGGDFACLASVHDIEYRDGALSVRAYTVGGELDFPLTLSGQSLSIKNLLTQIVRQTIRLWVSESDLRTGPTVAVEDITARTYQELFDYIVVRDPDCFLWVEQTGQICYTSSAQSTGLTWDSLGEIEILRVRRLQPAPRQIVAYGAAGTLSVADNTSTDAFGAVQYFSFPWVSAETELDAIVTGLLTRNTTNYEIEGFLQRSAPLVTGHSVTIDLSAWSSVYPDPYLQTARTAYLVRTAYELVEGTAFFTLNTALPYSPTADTIRIGANEERIESLNERVTTLEGYAKFVPIIPTSEIWQDMYRTSSGTDQYTCMELDASNRWKRLSGSATQNSTGIMPLIPSNARGVRVFFRAYAQFAAASNFAFVWGEGSNQNQAWVACYPAANYYSGGAHFDIFWTSTNAGKINVRVQSSSWPGSSAIYARWGVVGYWI